RAGEAVRLTGTAMVGWSGLRRVEYWVRPDAGGHGRLADDDPAWGAARWQPCRIEPPPRAWGGDLPDGVLPRDVWGFDPQTGRPRHAVRPGGRLPGLGPGRQGVPRPVLQPRRHAPGPRRPGGAPGRRGRPGPRRPLLLRERAAHAPRPPAV